MNNQITDVSEVLTINPALANRIRDELDQNVYLCYQCIKCTSGCPVGEFFDWQPNQIMRALQLGEENIALHSQTPWLCASCQTCATRCPQDIDITAIMEFLTREALQRGIKPLVPVINDFNQAMLREVRIWGRLYELGLMAELKIKNLNTIFDDVDLYVRMLKKMKVGFLPHPAHPAKKVKPIAGASKIIAYYPGCSLHSTATEFNTSAKAVCQELDMQLIEPKGWVCCGSSAAHKANPEVALKLPLMNLSLIEQSGFHEVAMPCAACFNRHKAAQFEIHHHESRWKEMQEAIGYHYRDTVQVTTLVDSIMTHTGAEKVTQKVQKPLHDLKVVCYYGCLLTRPPRVTQAEHPENPTDMDRLIEALGAEVLDWSYKTTCCGAAHSLTRPDIVIKLSGKLIEEARASGADVIAVACPLCHTNLDARQFQMKLAEPMPVMYFTQLMALALNLPEKAAALHKNLIDPRPLLRQKAIIS